MAKFAFTTITATALMARGAMIAAAPDDGVSGGGGAAPVTFTSLHDQITGILAEGLTPDAVADAICAAVGLEKPAPEPSAPLSDDDPAVTGIPRDETVDSIDAGTGTLTPEAQAARQKLADDQAKLAADEAAVEQDKADVAADEAALGEGGETAADEGDGA